ncbi:Calcium And Integrin-Binding Family Member 2 [Manis pentadactyla]|nr:Calcium And Integrin-Binding Family Member 2 [Manis pentadactyla]
MMSLQAPLECQSLSFPCERCSSERPYWKVEGGTLHSRQGETEELLQISSVLHESHLDGDGSLGSPWAQGRGSSARVLAVGKISASPGSKMKAAALMTHRK